MFFESNFMLKNNILGQKSFKVIRMSINLSSTHKKNYLDYAKSWCAKTLEQMNWNWMHFVDFIWLIFDAKFIEISLKMK